MKFNFLKTSFKNGMVSPRLRGREKEGDTTNSAEKLENFIVDRVGGAVKRKGTTTPLISESLTVPSYFNINIRGREFLFRFDSSFPFNAIKKTASPSIPDDYQSTFLHISEVTNGNIVTVQDVRPYAPYYTGTATTTYNEDLMAFHASAGWGSTGLMEYLTSCFPIPTHMVKVSDATVIFSCAVNIPSFQNISFSVSLIDLPVTNGSDLVTQTFIILPYFVSVASFVGNLGKLITAVDYYSPIVPKNFPFNDINTNLLLKVNTAIAAGQTGTAITDKQLSLKKDKLAFAVDIPKAACISAIDGSYTSAAMIGKFILIPDSTNVWDTIFFITGYIGAFGNNFSFTAIQIVGGTTAANTSLWKVSTFGGQTHPSVVGFCFNRLIYANAGIAKSRWWASALHPSYTTDFQSFSKKALVQDVSSNISKMSYEDILPATVATNYTSYGITDSFRFGFSANVPNLSPISFIESRTKIHFGTLAGEVQLIIGQGVFNKESFEMLKIRTNSATLAATTSGDGKFFYISNNGKDIRFISTEDKYYESLDGLMTAALEGLNLYYTKIIWYEGLNSIVAITSDRRVFFITVHEDTQVKAITEFKCTYEIIDICASFNNLYFVLNFGGLKRIVRYADGQGKGTSLEDLYQADISVLDPWVSRTVLYPFYINSVINILFNGVIYTMNIDGTGTPVNPPFDFASITYNNPALFYGTPLVAKLKTAPLVEGGGNNSAVGDTIRIDRATVQVDGSGPFKIGNENGTIYDVEGQSLSVLKTKFVNFNMPQSDDVENHLYIETDSPTPLNISGVSFRGMSKAGE